MALLLLLSACQPAAPAAPTPTPVVIAKLLATAYISPTPNAEQIAATRAAASPTAAPITPTNTPAPTAFVGIFIGEAPQDAGFQPITAPLFDRPPNISPTPDSTRCTTPIQPVFLALWQTETALPERLGCPIQESFGFFAEAQIFDNGVIYWRRDTDEVWALLPGDPAGRFWYVANPAPFSTADVVAPIGRQVPEAAIGSVWAVIPDLRQGIGFAQTGRQQVALNLQRFDGGTFLLDATVGQVFGLLVDGTAYGAYAAPELQPADLLTAGTPPALPATATPDAPPTDPPAP